MIIGRAIKDQMRTGKLDFREGTRQLGLVMDSRKQATQRNLPKIEDLPPGRPPKKVEIPPETGTPVQNPQDVKPKPLEPKPADSKSEMSSVMEAANEKPEGVPSEEPVELIEREPDKSFETAYEEMTQPNGTRTGTRTEPAPKPNQTQRLLK